MSVMTIAQEDWLLPFIALLGIFLVMIPSIQ